jgi:flagellar hook-associated protein 2
MTTTVSSTGSISSAGIGSGLDVESIITKLMSVEKLPVQTLEDQASTIQTKISAFGSVQSALGAFRDASLALTKNDAWSPTVGTSADASAVTVSTGSTAAAGNYAVTVTNLAASQSVASKTYTSSDELAGEGTLTIEQGSWDIGEPGFAARATISAINIPISSTDSLSAVRDKINAAGAGVTASIVTDSTGARLVLSSSKTGVQNGFRVTTSGSDALAALTYDPTNNPAGMTLTQTAADATATVNGLAITSDSNTLTNVVDGLSINLLKKTPADGTSVQLNVAQDNTTIKAKIQAFVDAYNSLSKTLASQTKYDDTSKTAGTLQGDSTAVGLQRQLRSALTGSSGASSVFSTLSSIGLEVQSDGTVKINDTKMTNALANLGELKKVFANSGVADDGTDGFAQRFRTLGDQVLGTDGSLTTRAAGLATSLKQNETRQDEMNNRLTSTEARLRAQYTALDTKMASFSTLSTYITQQIANWNKSTG